MHFRSVFKSFIFAAFFIAAASIGLQAQTGAFSGTVTVKKADGTLVPAVGVTITPYRTDTESGGAKAVQTNDKGEFRVSGLNSSHQFALLVSGPGISPSIQPGVSAGMDGLKIEVPEGNGSTFSEAEVRNTLKQNASMTDEDREKLKKQIEENAAARRKAESNYQSVNAALKAGEEAFKAKNYDLAIAKFEEGVNADPDFAGSAPVLLRNKGIVLRTVGYEAYRESIKGDRAANLAIAKTKWEEAAKAFDRGLEILAAAQPKTPEETSSYAQTKKQILTDYVEVFRLAYKTGANTEVINTAEPIYTQYFEVETDGAQKAAAKAVLADMIFVSGDMDKAIKTYREAIAAEPNQPDALSGLGIALYTNAEMNDDPAQLQEAANALAQFLKVAPEKHINRPTAQSLLETLKTDKKITPKK